MAYFNKLCRACLNSKESFKYFLFENVSPNLYSFCTSVEVRQNENLPKAICDTCYEHLTKFFTFKQTCMKSENTLLECNNTVKSECNVLESVDDDLQCENVLNDYENDTNIKTELIDAELCINDRIRSLKNDSALFIKDEIPRSSPSRKKKISRRLKKVTSPKKILVKSISNINLSTLEKKQVLSCKLCKKIFSYPERYEAHKLEHEGKKVSISCGTCDKRFVTWSGLRRHNESEHTRVNLDSLKCRICGKTSKNRHTLRMHEKTHGQRSTCICDVCGNKFVSTAALKAHLQTHEENRERKHECQHCGKKFFSNTVLLSHVSKRHSGKKFVCQICAYPFSEKSNLVRHMRLHEGKKLYKCDLCDKSYSTNYSLIEHKRTHSGERPFSCAYCPKSFSAKKRLEDHHRIHTGEKPHKCNVCGQAFTQRGTLKRHMKVHEKFPSALD